MTTGKGNLSLLTDPYASARKFGRATMKEEALTIVMQWASVAEDQATRDMLWDIVEAIKAIDA